jgi:hypothetical protein
MVTRLALAGSLLALIAVGCGGETETFVRTEETSAPAQCDAVDIYRTVAEKGAVECLQDGRRYRIRAPDRRLRLRTLTAEFVGYTTEDSISSDGGSTTTPSGRFVVVTLHITSEVRSTQSFGGAEGQTLLTIDETEFSEASFSTARQSIQPGETLTAKVVYDVPAKLLGRLEENGAVTIVDFGAGVTDAKIAGAFLVTGQSGANGADDFPPRRRT